MRFRVQNIRPGYCEKWALKRLVKRAIERQPKESPHWHSPRRDAYHDVQRSLLFTLGELEEIKRRLATFEEEAIEMWDKVAQ